MDGTGKAYKGDGSDTNIVKIFQMLDRRTHNQFHYYQPGIGTYVQQQHLIVSNWSPTRIWTGAGIALDYAIGTTFQTHVMDAYKFIMRYYMPGDLIYVFGFSRGAYAARYLCEMIASVGMLSMGNEAMVHYAWRTFSQYQNSKKESKKKYMEDFKKSFSREGVEAYFLGMFDCVNSVATVFEMPSWFRKSSGYLPQAPATHMRHAVSIGERRSQFKPALVEGFVEKGRSSKEVWFAGQHGDVGGGWKPQEGQPLLLSDLSLAWMINEVLALEREEARGGQEASMRGGDESIFSHGLRWHEDRKAEALRKGQLPGNLTEGQREMLEPHDYLKFSKKKGGRAWLLKALAWWTIEILPFAHLELRGGKWVLERFPPNLGRKRDVPSDAVYHPSVHQLDKLGMLKSDDKPNVHQAPDEPHHVE
jgi:hypothetical protein